MSFATRPPSDLRAELADAARELARLTDQLAATRRRNAEREGQGAAVTICEWQVSKARERLDRLRSQQDWRGDDDPPDAA